jgi:BON domain
MRTLFRLLVLAVLVVGVFWLLQHRDLGQAGRQARAEGSKVVRETRKALSDVDVDKIVRELKETGQVIRRKAAPTARRVAEATQDARTTAAIKAKIALDPNLSVLDISVDTTDGKVTLAGRVDAPEDVARAIHLAMEQDEVTEVVSTLQVRERRAGATS